MLRYTSYNRSLIILTERSNAFIYITHKKAVPFTSINYGKGRKHWFEYLGCFSFKDCQGENPGTLIKYIKDETLPKLVVGKVRELECIYIED